MLLSKQWLTRFSRSTKCFVKPGRWERNLASVVDPKQLRPAGEEAIRLRQYQEECIQSVLSYLQDGHKRLGISLATGSGKTVRRYDVCVHDMIANIDVKVIFTQLIERVKALNPRATQTLILAHRRELVEQAARHCARAYPDKTIDIEMGNIHASGAADITVASLQSMISGDRLDKYQADRFKLVLVDEAHHIVAPGYMQTLRHFGLEAPKPGGPALVGVSATFSRFDGLRLGAAIDHIVYHKDYVDMIGEKWLSDVRFTTVKSSANLSKVKSTKDGDFQTKQLSSAVSTEEVNEITVRSWISEASDRDSTLVFCVDLSHLASLTDAFRRHGIDARYVTGETRKKTRAERLDAFKNKEYSVLLNCGVFTEGTDIPNIDCVLLARPTKSRNLLVQMIGRGMRLFPGKEDCLVIDMVASLETGIVTVPTLFGLDPSEVVKSASAQDLRERKEGKGSIADAETLAASLLPSPEGLRDISDKNLTFTYYDSVHDLIEDTSGERHVRSISPNAWVQVDSHKYILAARGGVLTLERHTPIEKQMKRTEGGQKTSGAAEITLPDYHVIWKHSIAPTDKSRSPWSRPRTVATANTLTGALNAADTFAASKFERLFIATSSSWRKGPASEGQLIFLNKLREISEEEPLTPEDITKGMAGDMITKVKFGARGRFDRLMISKRKSEKISEKVRELRRREEVQVGPLAN